MLTDTKNFKRQYTEMLQDQATIRLQVFNFYDICDEQKDKTSRNKCFRLSVILFFSILIYIFEEFACGVFMKSMHTKKKITLNTLQCRVVA